MKNIDRLAEKFAATDAEFYTFKAIVTWLLAEQRARRDEINITEDLLRDENVFWHLFDDGEEFGPEKLVVSFEWDEKWNGYTFKVSGQAGTTLVSSAIVEAIRAEERRKLGLEMGVDDE